MIQWHRHHIIPRHAGGSDDDDNLLRVNVAMHAFMHEQLYKQHGRWQDKFASQMLKNGKGCCDWRGRTHSQKTKNKIGKANAENLRKMGEMENRRRTCILPQLSNSLRSDGLSITKTATVMGISVSSVKRYQKLHKSQ